MRISRVMGRLSYPALIVGMLAAPTMGHAAEAIATNVAGATDPASDTAVTVKGVTVTVVQHAPLTATFTEDTISGDTVRNLSPGASTTIQTMLNQEPSVFVFSDGPLGVRTNTNFRAFTSSEFSESVDGIDLNDVFNGGVTNQASVRNNVVLTDNTIDSVQVYRGINNPAVNSYDSLGGTINFITRAPTDKAGVEAEAAYGSFDTLDWRATVNTGEVHGLSQVVSLESESSNGWQQNTDDRNLNLYYGANERLNQDNTITARFVYDWNGGYTPTNMPLPIQSAFGRDFMWSKDVEYERNHDTNIMGILGWNSKLSPIVTFDSKLFAAGNDYQRVSYVNPNYVQGAPFPSNSLVPTTGPFAVDNGNMPYYIDNTSFNPHQDHHFYGYRTWAVGYTGSLSFNLPNNLVTIGGNYTYADLYSREYFGGVDNMPKILGTSASSHGNDFWDEQDNRTYLSLYVQDDISLLNDNLHITPGIKYLYAQTRDLDHFGLYYQPGGKDGGIEHAYSPTLGVSYKFLNNWSVFGAVGQNTKFPEISGFYGAVNAGPGGATPAISVKPEYVSDYELGVRFQRSEFYATANVYREDFQNIFINGTDPATGASVVQNGGAARYEGVELQLAQDLKHVLFGDLHLYLNYAHNIAKFTSSFTDFASGNTVQSGQNLSNIPQDLLSTGFTWKRDGWRFDLDGRYVGVQYIDQQFYGVPGPGSNEIHPYFVMNLGLSKTIDIHTFDRPEQVRFAINVDNLLDRYYQNEAYTATYNTNSNNTTNNNVVSGIAGAPRSVMGSITVAF